MIEDHGGLLGLCFVEPRSIDIMSAYFFFFGN
jgi:hypothetical protein